MTLDYSFVVFKFNVLLKFACLDILFKIKVSYCFVMFSQGKYETEESSRYFVWTCLFCRRIFSRHNDCRCYSAARWNIAAE